MIRVERLQGERLDDALGSLARLRIAVFREFPYLYDGSLAYEQDYLAGFAASPDAVLIAARDGEEIVGAATASPLSEQDAAFVGQVEAAGIDTASAFYFGESVLLPEYRGQGLGHAFFDKREAAAREHGATTAIFASVIRAPDHPARPEAYRPLDAFWRKRGYAPVEGLVMTMAWKELGESAESPKRLQCWMRRLA